MTMYLHVEESLSNGYTLLRCYLTQNSNHVQPHYIKRTAIYAQIPIGPSIYRRTRQAHHVSSAGEAAWGKLKKYSREQAGVTSYMDIPLPSNQASLSLHTLKNSINT